MYPNIVESNADTLETPTVPGAWYECTDGTWVRYADKAGSLSRHYDRKPTREEEAEERAARHASAVASARASR